MACETLKTQYAKLEAQIAQLRQAIANAPRADQPPLQHRLTLLSSQAWTLGQEYVACMQGVTGVKTAIDLNGRWAYGGIPGPTVSVKGNAITIDMSVYQRPAAFGGILDAADIWVTFPDDNSYTGTLHTPNIINWSNGSQWTRVSD